MSKDKTIVAIESTRDHRGAVHVLRTASGALIRVNAEIYRRVIVESPLYLHISLSNEPGPEDDPVVVADVIELESRLATVKKEATELREKLAKLLETCP